MRQLLRQDPLINYRLSEHPKLARATRVGLERLPSLDGLRAVSITLVIIGHALSTIPRLPAIIVRLLSFVGNGDLGVSFFFVISGYLITYLMLKELGATDGISLHKFYVRRATRILPAFLVYLVVIGALAAIGYINVSIPDYVASATFLWNYVPWTSSWWLGQTWSLSVEEQFYILWPITLRLLGSRKASRVAVSLICAEPVIRVLTYLLWPSYRGRIPIMLHTRVDNLMFGCMLALLQDNKRFRTMLEHLLRPVPLGVATLWLVIINPLLNAHFGGRYYLPLGLTLQGACITLVVAGLLQHPDTRVGRLLNSRPVERLGLISYSLYLWQQLFLTPLNKSVTGLFPINVVFALVAATASYYIVEKPVITMRSRFLRRARPTFRGGGRTELIFQKRG